MTWNATERLVVLQLTQHRALFPEGMSYPTLATLLRCSHRTLQRAVARLASANLVKRVSTSAKTPALVKLASRSVSPGTGPVFSPVNGSSSTGRRVSSRVAARSKRRVQSRK